MRVTKKIKAEQVRILSEVYAGAKPALKFNNPFELLVAVILSAQCTDKRVNVTTARLFAKAATPEAIVQMGLPALEDEIRDCGLFRNKAKNIMATCMTLCEKYGGEVPEDYDELLKLPGVGRKRHRRRHPRLPRREPPEARGRRDAVRSREGSPESYSERRLERRPPLAHLARKKNLQGAQAALRRMPIKRSLPERWKSGMKRLDGRLYL